MVTLNNTQHFLRTGLALAYGARAAYEKQPLQDANFSQIPWNKSRIIKSDRTGTHGFVCVNDENMVVAFRGTVQTEIDNWLTNLKYPHHETRFGGGLVHHGFLEAWRSVRQQVHAAIADLRKNRQVVWLTGHSLGAALATLASRDMPSRVRPAGVYTFGSPRVGNPQFVSAYNVTARRFVNESDIVPHVPLQGLFVRYKYGHVGHRQLIMPDGSITSSEMAWIRLLRSVARVVVMGIGSLPAKAVTDHSMNRYVDKLANHGLNQR